MRPNVVVLGFPDHAEWRRRGKERGTESPLHSPTLSDVTVLPDKASEARVEVLGELPTDSDRLETPIKATTFVGIIEVRISSVTVFLLLRFNSTPGVCRMFWR